MQENSYLVCEYDSQDTVKHMLLYYSLYFNSLYKKYVIWNIKPISRDKHQELGKSTEYYFLKYILTGNNQFEPVPF